MEKDFAFAPPAHYFQKFPNLFTNVVIDILHAKLRIVGCLLSLQISKMTVSGIKSLEAKIQKLKGMSQFQFRKKQPATTLALQATNDKIELEVPYMNADQADMILLNYESIMMESLSDTQFNDNDFKVWSSLRFIIYHYLEASQGLLDLNFKKEELKEYLSFTKKVLREAFPNDQLAYYINIILYHLPDLLEKYGSLTKYMNQGCEAYHSLGRMIGQRKSNHKGKFNLPSFAESILLPTRTLYMSSKFKKKWHGLKTNPNMQISSEWQTTLATLKQDFEKLKSCSESLSDFSEEKKNSVYCHVQKNIWKKIVIENEPPEADESDSEGNKEDNNKIKKNNTKRMEREIVKMERKNTHLKKMMIHRLNIAKINGTLNDINLRKEIGLEEEEENYDEQDENYDEQDENIEEDEEVFEIIKIRKIRKDRDEQVEEEEEEYDGEEEEDEDIVIYDDKEDEEDELEEFEEDEEDERVEIIYNDNNDDDEEEEDENVNIVIYGEEESEEEEEEEIVKPIRRKNKKRK
ncbi:predicted protein [Naegleria gruberi]|uniref:Predicted protein n=1 Tax=Naegleria gruberi TaxID=5762 RepID=D2VX07_NAEGR|nr:uncharacterized protein NAEGRDRAFT_73573 [Naegleria gruberi]EFC38786.1 predicted protein [Naegleria gruberi]|eukprot:XP_002671530.1 predicted protein [Naegleria gruberi strain NEG-M]